MGIIIKAKNIISYIDSFIFLKHNKYYVNEIIF